MSSKAEMALEVFKSYEGEEEGIGEWFEVDQERINLFADATMDKQFFFSPSHTTTDKFINRHSIGKGFRIVVAHFSPFVV